MKKHLLIIGIIFLFFASAFTPMALAYNVRTLVDTQEMKNLVPPLKDPPNEIWNKTFSRTGPDYGGGVQQTSDGGYIITGGNWDPDTMDWDALLLKTDKDGNIEFYNLIGGQYDDYAYGVRETSDKGFIIVGSSKNSYDNDDPRYTWLVKTDENGSMLWEKKYELPVPDTIGKCVFVLDDGFFIMSEVYYDLTIWLLKTDFDGNELWIKRVGSTKDNPNSIIQTKNGDFVILGSEFHWFKSVFVLIKTDMNGNTLWRKTYEGWGSDIVEVEDGSYVIKGGTNKVPVLDCLFKINSNGEILWIKTFMYPDDYILKSLIQTSDGGFVIVGCNYIDSYGNSEAVIIKTDSDGNKLWEKTYHIGEYIYDVNSVIESDDDNYVFLGSTAEYDPPLEMPDDIWLVKLSPFENLRPNKPSRPNSHNMGKPLVSYIFNTSSSDPDGNLLYYIWSWGNGKYSNWVGPYENNETCEIKYFGWLFPGTYKIKVIAKDVYGGESDCSDPLTITVTRTKATNNVLFWKLLEQFPLLREVLLRLISR